MKIKLNLKEIEILRQALLFYSSNFSRNSIDAMILYSKLVENSARFNYIKNKK